MLNTLSTHAAKTKQTKEYRSRSEAKKRINIAVKICHLFHGHFTQRNIGKIVVHFFQIFTHDTVELGTLSRLLHQFVITQLSKHTSGTSIGCLLNKRIHATWNYLFNTTPNYITQPLESIEHHFAMIFQESGRSRLTERFYSTHIAFPSCIRKTALVIQSKLHLSTHSVITTANHTRQSGSGSYSGSSTNSSTHILAKLLAHFLQAILQEKLGCGITACRYRINSHFQHERDAFSRYLSSLVCCAQIGRIVGVDCHVRYGSIKQSLFSRIQLFFSVCLFQHLVKIHRTGHVGNAHCPGIHIENLVPYTAAKRFVPGRIFLSSLINDFTGIVQYIFCIIKQGTLSSQFHKSVVITRGRHARTPVLVSHGFLMSADLFIYSIQVCVGLFQQVRYTCSGFLLYPLFKFVPTIIFLKEIHSGVCLVAITFYRFSRIAQRLVYKGRSTVLEHARLVS